MSRVRWKSATRTDKSQTIFAGIWKHWRFIQKAIPRQYSVTIIQCINFRRQSLLISLNGFLPHQNTLNQLTALCSRLTRFKWLVAIATHWQRRVAWRITWITISINSTNNSSNSSIMGTIRHSRIQWTSCEYDAKSHLMMKFRTFICKEQNEKIEEREKSIKEMCTDHHQMKTKQVMIFRAVLKRGCGGMNVRKRGERKKNSFSSSMPKITNTHGSSLGNPLFSPSPLAVNKSLRCVVEIMEKRAIMWQDKVEFSLFVVKETPSEIELMKTFPLFSIAFLSSCQLGVENKRIFSRIFTLFSHYFTSRREMQAG